ncbi:lysophospholipid acyltransferase family protein [Nocardia sp. AG03]|uniref:lysophospholipid acyltransferase family protein n=1 Tax=Nocardia sp. AG03 TaxID=3025312 RepID=UPI002418AF18|nr:lysophospholipid acyltransferase family protein [Nocardia sp. AG03]
MLDPAPGPVLVVANHGFGGIFDLNVLAARSAYVYVGDPRRVVTLTHHMAWAIGLGPLLGKLGAEPATGENALRALARGEHVLVFPGGDVDAFKSWGERNEIVFAGRTGFARLAIQAGVPIVPVVTSGAGESLICLSDGRALARWLRLDEVLRLKRLPITLSLPWGLTAGIAGLLPYFPLPTKIRTTVLPVTWPEPGESPAEFAERVRGVMQEEMDRQTANRVLLLG